MPNIQKPTRQIKFRVWDKDNKCFFEPTYEAYKGNLEELNIGMAGDLSIRTIDEMRHESMFPERFILMQFTGLQDKNGKDIYEGDILATVMCNSYRHPNRVLVEYRALAFMYVGLIDGVSLDGGKTLDTITNPEITQDNGVEIIGNIYENHELL